MFFRPGDPLLARAASLLALALILLACFGVYEAPRFVPSGQAMEAAQWIGPLLGVVAMVLLWRDPNPAAGLRRLRAVPRALCIVLCGVVFAGVGWGDAAYAVPNLWTRGTGSTSVAMAAVLSVPPDQRQRYRCEAQLQLKVLGTTMRPCVDSALGATLASGRPVQVTLRTSSLGVLFEDFEPAPSGR